MGILLIPAKCLAINRNLEEMSKIPVLSSLPHVVILSCVLTLIVLHSLWKFAC
jgi:hypothetical protein